MLTHFGVIAIVAAFLIVYKPVRYIYLLPLSSIFLAASVLNFRMGDNDYGIIPYYFVGIFFALRVCSDLLQTKSPSIPKDMLLWLAFLFYASFITLLGPLIFSGLPVFDPRAGIDLGVYQKSELKLSTNNMSQFVYLIFNIFLLFCFVVWYRTRTSSEKGKVKERLIGGFSMAGFLNVLAIFLQQLGHFPYELTHNHPAYSILIDDSVDVLRRSPGLFTEPSYAGGFLVAYAAYLGYLLIFEFRPLGLFIFAMTILAILFTTSTTGYLVLALLGLNLFIWLIIRFIRRPRIFLGIGILLVFTSLILTSLALTSSPMQIVIEKVVLRKAETSSFENRTSSDIHALWLLGQSYGMGVGLGSNRPSSFLFYMLGNVGVLGSFLFFGALALTVTKAWFNSQRAAQSKGMILSLFYLIIAKILALPDFFSPDMWVLILITSAITHRKDNVDL